MFLVISFFFSEIYHFHKLSSLVKDGYGYVLKITDSLLLSFCTQGFGPELQNPIVFKPYKSFSPWKKEFGRTDGVFWNAGV